MSASTSREPLSRERVLAAAVSLVDADGLTALTMRRLAASLHVEAMSLYHYLPGKGGLLDGLVDAVCAEIEEATSSPRHARTAGDWRASIKAMFLAARRVMVRHPWAPALIASRHTIAVAVFQYYERILGVLVDAGFSYRLAHRALHAFGSLPLGFAQEVFAPTGEDTTAEADLAAIASALPHMAAMVAAEVHDATDPVLGWCDSQTEFEFTLDLLLDGLERLRSSHWPSTAPA